LNEEIKLAMELKRNEIEELVSLGMDYPTANRLVSEKYISETNLHNLDYENPLTNPFLFDIIIND